MNNDIFDLDNKDDLPGEIVKQLGVHPISKTKKIIDMFDLKTTLTVPEIIVAFYRIYKETLSRNIVYGLIHNLIKSGHVVKVRAGVYKLIEKGKDDRKTKA